MPHSPAVGNHFFDETFAHFFASSMAVKPLLFLLLALVAAGSVRAGEMVAAADVAGRLVVAKDRDRKSVV